MNNDQIAEFLHDHDVRPTALRILLWKTLCAFDYAFSQSDLEGQLPTVDRSTIFRALTLFVQHHLLHPLDDGSGMQKYCICSHAHHASDAPDEVEACASMPSYEHDDCQHVHITCVKCGHTYCLKDEQIPQVDVPEGFQILHVQYVIQGVCPRCAHYRRS